MRDLTEINLLSIIINISSKKEMKWMMQKANTDISQGEYARRTMFTILEGSCQQQEATLSWI